MVSFKKLAAVLGTLCALGAAYAQRVPFAEGDANFRAEELLNGVAATQQQCALAGTAVWARTATGEAECIRYWASGMKVYGPISRVLVYIPSDQMAFDTPNASYTGLKPSSMQSLANGMQARAEAPFILLSRPGIFGSSGEHKQRRRELEPRLVSAALDEIKKRYSISEFSLVGLSGGGHIVASLLGWRTDIVCAVPASSVSSPRMRWQGIGRTSDLTGYADSYEPVENLKPGHFHPRLRVFVLGDPKDGNVPWSTQTPLADRLRTLGVAVEAVHAEGSDSQRHVLGNSGQRLGALCLHGRTTKEILEIAAQGLKG
jgi:hypothetical protein